MKTIEYYFSPQSPWSYLGHQRLLDIAARHGAQVDPRPVALSKVIFPNSGGVPMKQRAPQRQAYRLVELKRWAQYLDLPLNLHPKYFPVSNDEPATLLIAAAINQAGKDDALRLMHAVYRAVWVDDKDIANPDTLVELANGCGLDGQALLAAQEDARKLVDRYTQAAMERQVFGAPWYVYNDESFWGQDRLDFLERALASEK